MRLENEIENVNFNGVKSILSTKTNSDKGIYKLDGIQGFLGLAPANKENP